MWRLYFDKVRMSRIPMRDNTGSNPVEIILKCKGLVAATTGPFFIGCGWVADGCAEAGFIQPINFGFATSRHPMIINVHCKFHGVMTELFGHVRKVISFGDPQGCVGVPQIVNSYFSKARLFQSFVKHPSYVALMIRLSSHSHKNPFRHPCPSPL